MSKPEHKRLSFAALLLALGIFAGLATLGLTTASALTKFRELERTVTVKGLAVREEAADIVIWPIQYTAASNELTALYETLEQHKRLIEAYLVEAGIEDSAISVAAPAIVDKKAQQYAGAQSVPFRYSATQVVTVYSGAIDRVRNIIESLADLGKQGIVFSGSTYENKTEYLFTRLNEIKPSMLEESTKHARSAAEKFALDSASRLGKIKQATQGQFSIAPRDKNNPHIKRVRVVSTIEYYLTD